MAGRAIKGHAPHRVNDFRVRKAAVDQIDIGGWRHARNRIDLTCDLGFGDLSNVVADQGTVHAIGNKRD